MFNVLEKLVYANSVSSCEGTVFDTIKNEIGIEGERDNFGNLKVFIDGGCANTVVIEAHSDQIGFIVTEVLERGFLRFETVGGIDKCMLGAQEVIISAKTGEKIGVITNTPPHLKKSNEESELYIDVVGQEGVSVGDFGCFKPKLVHLEGEYISGTSLDNRLCVAILCQLAKRVLAERVKGKKLKYNVEFGFVAQEEVGCRGAKAYMLRHDTVYVIALDVTHGTSPNVSEPKGFPLDKGMAICKGPSVDKFLTASIEKTAKMLNKKVQFEVIGGNNGTDAWEFQTKNGGVATSLISVPLRYMHTPVEVANFEVANDIVDVLYEIIVE